MFSFFFLDKTVVCGENAVGLASKAIPDWALSASSIGNASTPAKNGRLNGGSSWCASPSDAGSYLQVDLGSVYIICGVATQGNPIADQWVRTYEILFSAADSKWTSYKEANSTKVRYQIPVRSCFPSYYTKAGFYFGFFFKKFFSGNFSFFVCVCVFCR